jgi:hypothetical protein
MFIQSSPCPLNLLQGDDGIVDDLCRFSEFAKLQIHNRVGCVENRSRAWHRRVLISGREFQLGMGDSEMIGGLSPGEVATIHDIAPLYGTGNARKIHGKDVALCNIPNVDDVRGKLGERAVHDSINHTVCAKRFPRNGTRVGIRIRSKDEAREDYKTYFRIPQRTQRCSRTYS